jgi:hypothetical protein
MSKEGLGFMLPYLKKKMGEAVAKAIIKEIKLNI